MAAASSGRTQINFEGEGASRVNFSGSPYSLIIHLRGDTENFLSYIGADYVPKGDAIADFIGQILVRLVPHDSVITLAVLTATITDSVIEIYDVSRRRDAEKGVGKILMELTVPELRIVSNKPIWLGTFEPDLVAFYRTCGFEPCDSSPHYISPLGYYSEKSFTSMFYNDATHPCMNAGIEKNKLHIGLKDLKVYQSQGVILEPSFTEEALTHISTQVWNSASESALLFYSKKETSDCIWDGQTIKIVEKLDVAIKTEPMIRIEKNKFQYMPLSPAPCEALSGKLIRGHTHNALLYRLIGGKDYYCAPPSAEDYTSAILAKDPVHLVFTVEGVYAININLSKSTDELAEFLNKYGVILKFFMNVGEIYQLTDVSKRESFAHLLQTAFNVNFGFGQDNVNATFSDLFDLPFETQRQRSEFAIHFLQRIFQYLNQLEKDFFVKVTFFNYKMSRDRTIVAINGIQAYSTNPSSILNAGDDSINSNRCFIDLGENNIKRYKAEINIGRFISEKTDIYQCFKPFKCVSIPAIEYIRLRVLIPTSKKPLVYYFPDKLSLAFYLKQIVLNLKNESLAEITIENDNPQRRLQLNDATSVVFKKIKIFNTSPPTISIDDSSHTDFPTTAILTQTSQPVVTATLSNGLKESFELPISLREILNVWDEDLLGIRRPIKIFFDQNVLLRHGGPSATPLKANIPITLSGDKGKFTHFSIEGKSFIYSIDRFNVLPDEPSVGASATPVSAALPEGIRRAGASAAVGGGGSVPTGRYSMIVNASAEPIPSGSKVSGATGGGGAGIQYSYYNKDRQQLGADSTGLPTSVGDLKRRHPMAKYIVFTEIDVKLSSAFGFSRISKNTAIDLTLFDNNITIAPLMGGGRRTMRRRLAKKQKSRKNRKN